VATGVLDFNEGFFDTAGFRSTEEIKGPSYYSSERQTAFSLKFFQSATPFYLGPIVAVATGSGLGTESAIGDVIAIFQREGVGAGTGAGSAIGLRTVSRTGTGNGAGSSAASSNPVSQRTGTGSGVGAGTSTRLLVAKRTATGSGVGSGTASGLELLPRTATGSGGATAGSTAVGIRVVPRTGAGSGTGDQSAVKDQLYLFRTPTDNRVQWARFDGEGLDHALFKFYTPGARGRNVYKLTDGTWTENEQKDMTLVSVVYHGGHDILVDATTRADLESAGYGDYVS
jgi:hypothetical protein